MRVSTRRVSRAPIDRKIFGHFIEAGFGRQVEGMWSEMIYNRSFIPIPPYRWDVWNWLGLNQEAYNANAPFWHSGYEELVLTHLTESSDADRWRALGFAGP